jgi:hypothetical protein
MAGTFGFNEPFQLNQRRHNLRHRSSTILCGRIRGNTPWPRCRILPSRSNGSPLSLVRACNAPVRADWNERPQRRRVAPRDLAGCVWWSGFLDHQLRRVAAGAAWARRGNPTCLRNARRITARNFSVRREVSRYARYWRADHCLRAVSYRGRSSNHNRRPRYRRGPYVRADGPYVRNLWRTAAALAHCPDSCDRSHQCAVAFRCPCPLGAGAVSIT